VVANAFVLFEIGHLCGHRSGFTASGAVQCTRYDMEMAGVGVLVGLISIVFPALTAGPGRWMKWCDACSSPTSMAGCPPRCI
jgi:hypothetical protein